jgi:hypothetical protein
MPSCGEVTIVLTEELKMNLPQRFAHIAGRKVFARSFSKSAAYFIPFKYKSVSA